MSRKTRYTATFSDGQIITRTSHREYAAAYRATWVRHDGGAGGATGFARDANMALKGAKAYGWPLTSIEIVPAVRVA